MFTSIYTVNRDSSSCLTTSNLRNQWQDIQNGNDISQARYSELNWVDSLTSDQVLATHHTRVSLMWLGMAIRVAQHGGVPDCRFGNMTAHSPCAFLLQARSRAAQGVKTRQPCKGGWNSFSRHLSSISRKQLLGNGYSNMRNPDPHLIPTSEREDEFYPIMQATRKGGNLHAKPNKWK